MYIAIVQVLLRSCCAYISIYLSVSILFIYRTRSVDVGGGGFVIIFGTHVNTGPDIMLAKYQMKHTNIATYRATNSFPSYSYNNRGCQDSEGAVRCWVSAASWLVVGH